MTSKGAAGPATLRSHRLSAGLSQEQLAERSRVSARTIRSLESGSAKRPHLDTLRSIAAALGLPNHERDELVAAWRASPRTLAELFHGKGLSAGLRAELERQRSRTRDQFVRVVVDIAADRRCTRHTVDRVIEAVDDGVDTFHWMLGCPPGFDARRLVPTRCVNVEPVETIDLPDNEARVFTSSFRRPLAAGETYSLSYSFDYGAARSDSDVAEPDNDTLFSIMASGPLLIVEVRFAPETLPARVWRVRQETVDGPSAPGSELAVSPFGVVTLCEMPARAGVHGIRWEWE